MCPYSHFGGFGKLNPDLIQWMNAFYMQTQIPLDPLYTGKMMYALRQDLLSRRFKVTDHLVCVHTGGLQGIEGMNQRLSKKGYPLLKFA